MLSVAGTAILSAFAGFALSCWLTRRTLAYALRRELLDQPGERRSHSRPTPRGGGLGIVLTALAAIALAAVLSPSDWRSLGALGLALAGVAGIGWLDDHHPLPVWPRLAVHAAAAVTVAVAVLPPPGAPAEWLVLACSIVALVTLINIWNFMDGIDGLATTQAAMVSVVAAILLLIAEEPLWAVLALVVAAAAAGFLPFNLPRARIFLGDVGSGALGLLVGSLLLVSLARGAIAWPGALILVSAFLIDGGLTLATRILRGDRWWQPHREHLYQWAVRAGFSHPGVTILFAYWTAAAALAVAATRRLDSGQSALVAATLAAVGATIWVVGRRKFQRIAREGQAQ